NHARAPEPAHGPPRRVRRRREEADRADRVLRPAGVARGDEGLPGRRAEEGLQRGPLRDAGGRAAAHRRHLPSGQDRRDRRRATALAAMSGIRVRSLTKSYGKFRVLHGIDLDVQPGEVLGLIGPNGAGKTTLMSCVVGFLHPDGGEVTIDDRAADDLSIRRRTGFVPERMNFDRRASGRAFLRYMAKLAGVPRAEVDARVDALLDRLGLADAGKRLLGQYSRGMLQRIGMCQALVREPDFLFLDEPTSGLDPNGVFL